MAAWKRCGCSNHSRCDHPWWLGHKPKGGARIRETVLNAFGANPKSKTDAEKFQAKFDEEVVLAIKEGRKPFARATVATFGDMLPKFLKLIRKVEEIDHFTDARKRSVYNQLREEFAGTPMRDLDGKAGILTIEEWRDRMQDAGKGVVACNRLLAELRRILTWGLVHDFIGTQPFGKDKVTLEPETPRDRRLAVGEEEELLDAAAIMDDLVYYHSGKKMGERVVFALETAARRGEMTRLQREDLDFVKGTITFAARKRMPVLDRKTGKTAEKEIRNTKNGKTRVIPMRMRVREILERYRATTSKYFIFGDQGVYVESFRTTWDTLNLLAHNSDFRRDKVHGFTDAQRAQIKTINLHWHDLRHEAISRWAESGAFTPDELMELAGHSNFKTTLRYIQRANGTLAKKMAGLDR